MFDGADHVDPVKGDDRVVVTAAAVAAEEPCLVLDDRSPAGEGGGETRELLVGRVAVRGHEAVVLEEVVQRAAEPVRARLGNDARQHPRRADVLGRDPAGQHLLLLD